MAARFKAAALESGEVSDEFCKALRRRQFVIVELDDDEAVDAIRSMWHAIDRVFALPAETKERVGGPYRAAPGCTREEVVGYRVHDDNEFLETRFIGDDPDAAVRWRPCPNAEGEIPGYELALSNARAVLQQVGRATLCAMARALRTPADVLIDLLDDPLDHNGDGGGSRVRDADGAASPHVSSAAMRLCRYPRPRPVATAGETAGAAGVPSTGEPASPESETVVAFGAHTDTTLITVSPAAAVAALEIESPSAPDGWVRPEIGADPNRDIVVFVGELMQVLTRSYFPAAIHRVIAPPASGIAPYRIAAPLLLRARFDAVLDTERLFESPTAEGTSKTSETPSDLPDCPPPPPAPKPLPPRLLPLRQMRVRDFHRMVEMQRARRQKEQLEQEHAGTSVETGDFVLRASK